MSHRRSAVFFILASFAIIGSVGAQQPAVDDAAAAQSTKAQQQVKQPDPVKSASPNDSSTNPQPTVGDTKPPTGDSKPSASDPQTSASNAKPAANSPQSLPTIHVNGGPSADILRSARDAGFKIKLANGTTHFCKSEAPLGSRFVTEHCMNEEQLTLYLSRAQYQKDQVTHMLGAPAVAN